MEWSGWRYKVRASRLWPIRAIHKGWGLAYGGPFSVEQPLIVLAQRITCLLSAILLSELRIGRVLSFRNPPTET